jgi:adenylosuccinate lyase
MTTTIMMEAVKAGVGRETAHKAIKEHAVATVNDLRDRKNRPQQPGRTPRRRRAARADRETLDAILARGDRESGAAMVAGRGVRGGGGQA